MKVRKIIYADEGKVLTNGTHYGTEIALADGVNEYTYYEISRAEYNAIMAEQEAENSIM